MTADTAPAADAADLDRLLCLTPDVAHAERVRLRCRKRLVRRSGARADPTVASPMRLLAPAVVGSVCVLYLVALAATSIKLDIFRP